jgi:hypothetical protein
LDQVREILPIQNALKCNVAMGIPKKKCSPCILENVIAME